MEKCDVCQQPAYTEKRNWLYQHARECKSELIYESSCYTVMKLAGNKYLVMNKILRQGKYYSAEYDYMGALDYFTAYEDSHLSSFKSSIEKFAEAYKGVQEIR